MLTRKWQQVRPVHANIYKQKKLRKIDDVLQKNTITKL